MSNGVESNLNRLIGALNMLVGNEGIHEDDCECDNTHVQNNTVCRYCWSREVRSEALSLE
ncbi:hypothetical protein QD47_29225 [Paenibacillus terrae]|uniref:Uncharacterized protein n=1 Tax=Paenibacillus terrae TaxID=159743 RepID=A0A0D7WU81_9BACL|nr:hypothetical protein QD47_29225 [Paenibacillus terrae]